MAETPMLDPEWQPVGPTQIPLREYLDYRRLSFAVLGDTHWYEKYLILGVAVSNLGLVVLVKGKTAGILDALRPLTRVEADVRVVGPIMATVSGGESVGAGAGRRPSGTFGCLVEDSKQTRYGLSCDHVVGALAGQASGDPVWAPARLRGGTTASRIGTFNVGSGVALSTSASNKVDGALIQLDKPSAHAQAIIGIPGAPSGTNRSLSFGDTLKKSGVVTGVTTGQFTYIVTLNVPYSTGTARFVDQIGIDGGGVVFADQGDSGAVVLDDADKVVGLQFAAAPQSYLGFANPIADVEASLGVTVV